MATGRSMQLTKQVGEYLASAELCRRGLISTTFTGNVPEFDILAINERQETIPIQVKTIKGGSWQFNARYFMNININNGIQIIKGKTKLPSPGLICILVKLIGQGKDDFYIIKMEDLQNILFESYNKWLKSKNFKRPRNPESTHCAISSSELSGYKDNWKLVV